MGSEGALCRQLAAHAQAEDAAIVALASRYGPLGPTTRVALPDQPTSRWALDGSVRSSVRQLRVLRPWIAHGGTTPIPCHIAPVAHTPAPMAEVDDGALDRLVELLSGDRPSSELAEIDAQMDRLGRRYPAAARKWRF